jgi:hypothetical protein
MTIKIWITAAAIMVGLSATYAVALKHDADWSHQCEKAGGIAVDAPAFKLRCIKDGKEIK